MPEELGVEGQGERFEGEGDDRSLGMIGVGRKDSDLLRTGFDRECAWVVAFGKGWMDEVELLGIRVPEERGGFALKCKRQCLRLEVGIGFAIQSVVNSDGRRLVQSHQLGQLGENGCH